MKQISLILFLSLISFKIIISQSFQKYELNTAYNDWFSDFIELPNFYLLTAAQSNISQEKTMLIKVPKDGSNPDTYIIDSLGSNKIIWTTVFYNNYFYSISSNDIHTDTMVLCITKIDTNFSVVSRNIYPTIKRKMLAFNQKTFLKDSILIILGGYRKSNTNLDYWSLYIEVDLNNLELIKDVFFNEMFAIKDYYYNELNSIHTFIVSVYGNNGLASANTIVRYDSTFSLLDTINLTYELNGNSNILSFNDSLFLISGKGINIWDIDPWHYNNRELRLQIVDSNFRFVGAKSFSYNDSVDVRSGYVQNLVQNDNNEYFIGGHLENHYPNTHLNIGVFIVKLDSNLDTIWQKHIPGNGYYGLARIMPTNDGGLVVIIAENSPPHSGQDSDACFLKIGTNGEITSFMELKLSSGIKLSLYPNPTTSQLNITLKSPHKIIRQLQITDLQGKKILQKQINAKQTKLDVSDLSKGVYILEGITNSGERFSRKFLKE